MRLPRYVSGDAAPADAACRAGAAAEEEEDEEGGCGGGASAAMDGWPPRRGSSLGLGGRGARAERRGGESE